MLLHARRPLLIALALLIAPTLAQAVEIYVGGGIGSEIEGGTLGDEMFEDPDATGDRYKLFAGLGLGRHLAVEATAYDFGGQRCCFDTADAGFESEADGYSAAVVGRLPLGRVSLFGKVGALRWNEDATLITIAGPIERSEEGTDLVTGAGALLRLGDHFELRGEWERFEFADSTSDGVWAGVQFRF
jgi:hypothetical protein